MRDTSQRNGNEAGGDQSDQAYWQTHSIIGKYGWACVLSCLEELALRQDHQTLATGLALVRTGTVGEDAEVGDGVLADADHVMPDRTAPATTKEGL